MLMSHPKVIVSIVALAAVGLTGVAATPRTPKPTLDALAVEVTALREEVKALRAEVESLKSQKRPASNPPAPPLRAGRKPDDVAVGMTAEEAISVLRRRDWSRQPVQKVEREGPDGQPETVEVWRIGYRSYAHNHGGPSEIVLRDGVVVEITRY